MESNSEGNEIQAAKLNENDDKLNKFKALAVKLKKELNEVKDQLQKSNSECSNLKSQLKNVEKDKEKISSPYQQIVKNFQSLQQEYDKLQDEHDNLKKKQKNSEQDLCSTINELTNVKEVLAETKIELDTSKKQLNALNNDKNNLEIKNKSLEYNLSVLTSELETERKKIIESTGLSESLIELRNQLDIKTTEVVELQDKLEQMQKLEDEISSKKEMIEELNKKIQDFSNENRDLDEQNKNINRQLESKIVENEQYKLELSDLHLKVQILQSEIENYKINQEKNSEIFNSKVEELESIIKLRDEEINKNNEEFEKYKFRVNKVFKQQQSANQNENFTKQIKELEETLDVAKAENQNIKIKYEEVKKEKEILQQQIDQFNSKIDGLQNMINKNENLNEKLKNCLAENEQLKNISRELQASLVNERIKYEKNYEKKITEIESIHKSNLKQVEDELESTKKHLEEIQKECEALKQVEQIPNNKIQKDQGSHDGISSNYDDLESIETISIPNNKRHSISSSTIMNPLEEILFSTEQKQAVNNLKDFTSHLTEAQSKIQNLNQLLEESESNNLLLTEQNRVLKNEIRRLQRSVERLEIAENLEYLKNILVKFLTLSGGDERQQLVPVITTILKLSRDEQNLLENVAINDNQNQSRWTGYLWSANR